MVGELMDCMYKSGGFTTSTDLVIVSSSTGDEQEASSDLSTLQLIAHEPVVFAFSTIVFSPKDSLGMEKHLDEFDTTEEPFVATQLTLANLSDVAGLLTVYCTGTAFPA